MKIYYSPASPYVRKVMVIAHELGLAGRIEKLPSAAHPVNRDRTIVAHNPLGKVPTFFADDGTVLYDSRVICEYLDATYGQGRFFPATGAARWRALTEQSLGDGLLDAALLGRYERLRPADAQWQPWQAGQLDKLRTALDAIEAAAGSFGDRFDIGTITIGCALGYLDLRYADFGWRTGRAAADRWFAQLSARPSLQATVPTA